jgi:acyl-CoA synthetase (AMP-forming)/AMP-acid ligase II/NADP-dependent 3-hydroxy acid dehydrogenase YdfG/aryl carrier-like protein
MPRASKLAERNDPESRPAESSGEPLAFDVDTIGNLPDCLERAAHAKAGGLVYIGEDGREIRESYLDLLNAARRVASGLDAAGAKPGDKILLQFEHQRAFITAFWGSVFAGCVPVPVGVAPSYQESNAILLKLRNAWELLGRPLVLSSATLRDRLQDLTRLFELPGWRVLALDGLVSARVAANSYPAKSGDVALMMLTSGSTGTPKAVTLSHRNVLARAAATMQRNAFSARDVSLNWMPLDHVAGLVYFHLRDVFLGCTQVHGPTETILRDPLVWMDWLDRHRVTITFAPNFAYGLVNEQAERLSNRAWDLSCVRHFMNGGEAVVARTARKFVQILQPFGVADRAMRPAWGMSETSSAVTFSYRFSLDSTRDDDLFVEVGQPIPGFAMRIVDENDRIVTEGVRGRLQVRGPSVTAGYFNNHDANSQAFTSDGWFKTGDLGVIRNGLLTITGRAKDDIIINGINYLSHEIETAAEEVEGVEPSFAAACAVRRPGDDTDKLAVFFCSKPDWRGEEPAIAAAIRRAVLAKIGVNTSFVVSLALDEMPKTAIGKIQRGQLSTAFAAGAYRTIHGDGAESYPSDSVPAWFFTKRWVPWKGHPAPRTSAQQKYLVLMDDVGLGQSLCQTLTAGGCECICVLPGTSFARRNDDTFELRPGDVGDYRELLSELSRSGGVPKRVLHLWTYGRNHIRPSTPDDLMAAQARGLYSCLGIARAFGALPEVQAQVLVVSSGTQAIGDNDPMEYEKTPLLGLLRTVGSELGNVRCRHIDLEAADCAADADAVIHELGLLDTDPNVAVRDGRRLVVRLEELRPENTESRLPPFERGGVYLLTGGLGGIGFSLARHLLEQYDARLLLVGRTELQEGSERRHSLDALRRLSSNVIYDAVDIANFESLEAAVSRACTTFGRAIGGIVHLAGTFSERPLAAETVDHLREALDAKVVGAWNLQRLLRGDRNVAFISFSSANGFFGGYGAGAYAAANAFLDAFVTYQRSTGMDAAYCIAWSLWDEVGMSRDYELKELSRSRGYQPISIADGLASLTIALQQQIPYVLVGLERSAPHIASHVLGTPVAAQEVIVYASRDAFTSKETGHPVLYDGQGKPVDWQLRRAPAQNAEHRDDEPLSHGSAAERIARLWREVLRVDDIGLDDNFFDLGGDSVRIAQLAGQLSELSGRRLSIAEVFQYPTIRAQAAVLARTDTERGYTDLDKSRRRGEQRRARRQKH